MSFGLRVRLRANESSDGGDMDERKRAEIERDEATILGRLAHQSSLEALEQLTSHGHHAVRWAAVQNIGRLSRSVALVKLEQALDDPHPHVRRAAAKSLQQLKLKTPG